MSITQRDLRIIEECRRTDEPVYILRGQDLTAKDILNFAHSAYNAAGTTQEFRDNFLDKFEAFLAFEKAHPDKMKVPDLRREEVDI